jgi:hypothetical protein
MIGGPCPFAESGEGRYGRFRSESRSPQPAQTSATGAVGARRGNAFRGLPVECITYVADGP